MNSELWSRVKCILAYYWLCVRESYSLHHCLLFIMSINGLVVRKGDYHRYQAEFASGDEKKEAAENSLKAYKSASDIALEQLAPTHPIRLGLALNFSVFYYEILNSPDRYIKLQTRFSCGAEGRLHIVYLVTLQTCITQIWCKL